MKAAFCKDASVHLREFYDNLSDNIPFEEINLIDNVHQSSETHVLSRYYWIRRVIEHCKIGEDDIFLDIGSGLGRPVLQIAMETIVKESRGIELSKTRVQKANFVLEEMKQRGLMTKVNFIHDTFLNADHWEGATIVYSWAECFDSLLPKIANIIKECETIRYIILVGCMFGREELKKCNLKLEKSYELSYRYMNIYIKEK